MNDGTTDEVNRSALDVQISKLVKDYGVDAVKASLKRCLTPATTTTATTERESSYSMTTLPEDLTRHVLDASLDPIFVTDSQGVIRLTNSVALELFGYDSLVGQNISLVIGGAHGPKHNAYLAEATHENLRGILDKMRDVAAHHRDGRAISVQVAIKIIDREESFTGGSRERYFVAYVHDLTRRKESVRLIEEETNLNHSILEASLESVILTDDHGIIQRVNQATVNVFGYETDELVGRNISLLVGGGVTPESHDRYIKSFHARGGVSQVLGKRRQLSAKRRDGTEFPCRIGVQKIPGTTMLVGFVQDISTEIEAMELAIEKQSAEALLFNMLPQEIAARLRAAPGHIADHFGQATVLFGDICGFTSLSNKLQPIEVVTFLNRIFTRFDEKLEEYGLNKLKTIGDAYMVADIPHSRSEMNDAPSSCAAVCHFACDMVRILEEYNHEHPEQPLSMRIGVNNGPVVAGVVGTKRFLYDIWGDAVNIASRMESTGLPGKIQVSQSVVNLLDQEEFTWTKRGAVAVKGIGEMETYLIDERSGTVASERWVPSPKPSRKGSAMNIREVMEVIHSPEQLEEAIMYFT